MTTSITKTFEVDSTLEETWANLSNPEKVVVCVPGASLTEKVDEDNYKGEVELKFGPVKAKYAGLIQFLERDASAHKMVLKGTGTDSKGKGGADMKMEGNLAAKGRGTEVKILMELNVTGMLGSIWFAYDQRCVQPGIRPVCKQFQKPAGRQGSG